MTAAVPVSFESVLPVSGDDRMGAGAGAEKAAAPAISSNGGGGDAQPEVVVQSV